ncbi:DnaJ domain-containing protein [Chitinophaga sp. MM2321]|uniref:J domain-containing protein n=1 Tax=Chitinophaga sp. MM2321 TaxID=3137178 RepID=UPI0032D596AA
MPGSIGHHPLYKPAISDPTIKVLLTTKMRDYYYILGIENNASDAQVKTAYRKLSQKFHPDKNDGDRFFEERFKAIQQAYETLSDPAGRTAYDRNLSQHNTTRVSAAVLKQYEDSFRRRYEEKLKKKEQEMRQRYEVREQRINNEAYERVRAKVRQLEAAHDPHRNRLMPVVTGILAVSLLVVTVILVVKCL